jgi:hypothetical protein
MHVNPKGKEKALVMLFNPTNENMEKELEIPLYYTGLQDKVNVSIEGNGSKKYPIKQNQNLLIQINIPADGFTWLILE